MNYQALFLLLFIHQIHSYDQKSLVVDIYPGYGWDMLRYFDLSPIFEISNFNISMAMQSCIEVIPIRQNQINLDSEMIDLFNSETHEYSSTIMVQAGGRYNLFKAGGSYSREYQSIKKIQAREQTITLRNQIDYLMFDVLLKQSCPVRQEVKDHILDIAHYLISDQPMMATYAAQLFVKTYGTHFTSRIHLGGSIIEEDFVRLASFSSSEETKRSYRAAAAASFMGTFSISAKFSTSQTTTDSTTETLKKSFIHKSVRHVGGSISLVNDSMTTWQSTVDQKPAIVRRGIENITSFIQSDKIPELSEINLARVREIINQAVNTYYEINSYPGCMNRSSSAFNWLANIPDDSCPLADTNSQFGGFIRTCTEDGRIVQRCPDYNMKNAFTQNTECPFNFQKYLIHQMVQTDNIYGESCRRCGFLHTRRCCDTIVVGTGQRDIKLYVCHSSQSLEKSVSTLTAVPKTYVYGGSFTSGRVNPVTGAQKCPSEQFSVLKLTNDLSVCLAERVIDTFALPFYGGMFSCSYGNPVLDSNERKCPYGYTAYVVGALDGDCILHACLEFQEYPDVLDLPTLVLPPFFDILVKNQTRPIASSAYQNESTVATSSINPSFYQFWIISLITSMLCLHLF